MSNIGQMLEELVELEKLGKVDGNLPGYLYRALYDSCFATIEAVRQQDEFVDDRLTLNAQGE